MSLFGAKSEERRVGIAPVYPPCGGDDPGVGSTPGSRRFARGENEIGYSVPLMPDDLLTAKEKREQKVFAAFAKRSGLKIIECSIKSCKWPMPDICCNLDGSDYFFELTEVVSQLQAQALNTKGVYTSAIPDPDELGPRAMVNIIRQKQNKTYEIGKSKVDLLLYFDKDFPTYFLDLKSDAGPTDIGLAVGECKRLGPFSRIWSYCGWSDEAKPLA
jgi:hypothetical protein